jgi:hypothetical protein
MSSAHARLLQAYLSDVCDAFGRRGKIRPWRTWRRSAAAVPVALSLTAAACGGATRSDESAAGDASRLAGSARATVGPPLVRCRLGHVDHTWPSP